MELTSKARMGYGPQNVKRGRIKEYVKKFKGSTYVDGKTPWTVKCDIPLPCATKMNWMVKGESADSEQLRAVAEGINIPSTPEAVELMLKKE